MTLKAYEKPTITTIDSAEILEQIGPAQAWRSGAHPHPYSEIDSTASGGSSTTFGR